MLFTPPVLRVLNCSWLSVDCGTTPKNLAGSAAALAAKTPSATTTTSAAVKARVFLLT